MTGAVAIGTQDCCQAITSRARDKEAVKVKRLVKKTGIEPDTVNAR